MERQERTTRRPYEPPRLAVIDFRAEEVLAVGCKTAMTPGSSKKPNPLNLNCRANGCFQIGS